MFRVRKQNTQTMTFMWQSKQDTTQERQFKTRIVN